MRMTLVNINYKGHIPQDELAKILFRREPPIMYVHEHHHHHHQQHQHTDGSDDNNNSARQHQKKKSLKIIIFPTGKCRIMGCRDSSLPQNLPFNMVVDSMMSATVVATVGCVLNLSGLATKLKGIYEPELFPALRLRDYNPLCVNVFASGKVVVMGLRTLSYHSLINSIICLIESAI